MQIAEIIVKKIKGTLSEPEEAYFDLWINRSEENRSLFNRLQLLEVDRQEVSRILELDGEMAWDQVVELSKAGKSIGKNRILFPSLMKYAAILILSVGSIIAVWKYNKPIAERSPSENAITLQLDNGEIQIISTSAHQSIFNSKGEVLGEQNKSELNYTVSKTKNARELVYNELKVPYGEKFTIILSDSTKIHLNAGSSLRYPVQFVIGQNRQVFLNGEGYFEVKKDRDHPFIVTSGDMDIRVLGTSFNVTAYPEDREITTVLVEGSVNIYHSKEKYNKRTAKLLEPGHKAEWDKFYKAVDLVKVNPENYIGWIDGKLVLKEISFKNIVKKLERKYKVRIASNYPKLNNQKFTATFDIETIEEVLQTFNEETPFEFKIDGSQISIVAPKN